MVAMTVDNRYLVNFRFHKKPKYKQVRRNELEIDEEQVWAIVEMKDKEADEKLSAYLYETIEVVFRLSKQRRFAKFIQLLQKIGLSLEGYDQIDEESFAECRYITYGIHPMPWLASGIQTILVKDLR